MVWELTMTVSPKMTGVAAWRLDSVRNGTRHRTVPCSRSTPIKASAVKDTTCLTPASVATTERNRPLRHRPLSTAFSRCACQSKRGSRRWSSRRDDDRVAVHHGGAVVAAPGGGAFVGFAAEEFDAEILLETDAPNTLPVASVEAAKLALAGLHKNAIAIDERCAARAGAPFIPINVANRGAPDFRACFGVQQMGDFLLAIFVEKTVCRPRRPGRKNRRQFVCAKRLSTPGQFFHGGSIGGGVAVALRSEPLRPIATAGSQRCLSLEVPFVDYVSNLPSNPFFTPQAIVNKKFKPYPQTRIERARCDKCISFHSQVCIPPRLAFKLARMNSARFLQ
jgi:hypothetical protein